MHQQVPVHDGIREFASDDCLSKHSPRSSDLMHVKGITKAPVIMVFMGLAAGVSANTKKDQNDPSSASRSASPAGRHLDRPFGCEDIYDGTDWRQLQYGACPSLFVASSPPCQHGRFGPCEG